MLPESTISLSHTAEYRLIANYYNARVANRSGVPLINHIVEGDHILLVTGASIQTRKGFLLHPLLQNDNDFSNNIHILNNSYIDQYAVHLALEYRNIANQYLSKRIVSSVDEIALSPIQQVNDMLVADKIQNYKDFILYHRSSHPRSAELTDYFENWLARLNIKDFDRWFEYLQIAFPPKDQNKHYIQY